MSNIFKLISVRNTPIIIKAPVYALPVELSAEEPADSEAAVAAAQLLDSVGTETVVNAHKEATAIIEAAKKEAAALIAAATEQGDQLKLDAYDQGYREGHQAGMDQARQAIEEATATAGRIKAEADVEADARLLASERQMVDIGLAVARKILNYEIAENYALILPVITAALDKVRDQDQITVRVSPQNLDLVNEAMPELQSRLSQESSLTVTGDNGLKNGDCVVETAFGVIDARLDTQLDAIKTSLKEASDE